VSAPTHPTFREALRFWVTLGFINFGGPTGQIALMHRELVERRRWISEERFLHALDYCMLLPGPEAQQLATYVGWLLHGTRGGIVAGAFFVIPSIFILLVLSWVYAAHGDVAWVAAIFAGLKPAVLAIVVDATIRIGRRALRGPAAVAVAALAFVGIFALDVPFPAIVIGAGLVGLAAGAIRPALFRAASAHGAAAGQTGAADRAAAGAADLVAAERAIETADTSGTSGATGTTARFGATRNLRVVATCLALWFAPVAAVALWRGAKSVFVRESLFFSKAAMVTFGGAYAVLPYVAQAAVERFEWLSADQMLDGLGLAETTPGPLIMVLQFVGFLGAWNEPGDLPPVVAGTIGALLTTWVTFVPCFLWIFLGAPYVERLRGIARLGAALSAITAAVVGVILNLAVWFAIETLRTPSGGIDLWASSVAVVAFVGLLRWKWNVVAIVVGAGVAGWLRYVVVT
jgi:chromate transporter